MATIPDAYLDLFQHKKAFASLATLMPDGTPQVTPVWFDYNGSVIRVNSAKGRTKTRNMQKGRRSRCPSWILTMRIAMCRCAAR
jgi:Pyridoxamine 5'-phosphate oxidase